MKLVKVKDFPRGNNFDTCQVKIDGTKDNMIMKTYTLSASMFKKDDPLFNHKNNFLVNFSNIIVSQPSPSKIVMQLFYPAGGTSAVDYFKKEKPSSPQRLRLVRHLLNAAHWLADSRFFVELSVFDLLVYGDSLVVNPQNSLGLFHDADYKQYFPGHMCGYVNENSFYYRLAYLIIVLLTGETSLDFKAFVEHQNDYLREVGQLQVRDQCLLELIEKLLQGRACLPAIRGFLERPVRPVYAPIEDLLRDKHSQSSHQNTPSIRNQKGSEVEISIHLNSKPDSHKA